MEAPVRTCLGCRSRRRKAALVRLVVEHGTVIADPSARRPGRGAYVCADPRCVDVLLAAGPRALGRALRVDPAAVRVDAEALRATVRERSEAGRADDGNGAPVATPSRGRSVQ